MNDDLTRKYNLPTPVFHSTALIVQQFKPSMPPPSSDTTITTSNNNLPDLQNLLSMKADLETILPLSENRLKDLKKDLNHLDKSVNGETTCGKNINVIMDKMKIKQESDDPYSSSSTSILENGMDKKIALDYIKIRRQEETDISDDVTSRSRSESPHQIIKLKKLDHILLNSSPSPSSPKQQSAAELLNRKKSSSNHYVRAQHLLSNGGVTSSSFEHSKSVVSNHIKNNSAKETTVEMDFVRVKQKDQVPITTFWTTLEPYFRTLTEEDRAFLLEKADNMKPYLIPPLGRYYLDQWTEQDEAIGLSNHHHHQHQHHHTSTQRKYVKQQDVTDDVLLLNDVSCGSLTERLISSLVAEDLIDPSEAVKIMNEEDQEEHMVIMEEEEKTNYNKQGKRYMMMDPTVEIVGFEERLKRELEYAGLFGGEEKMDLDAIQDDEISAELRTLGRELKDQVKQNNNRKNALLQVIDTHLAFEQYRKVLDNLDSQVEQGYMKRFRPQKSKKRKSTGSKTMLSENALYAMEKRKIWKTSLGPIFNEKNMLMPSRSIYTSSSSDELTHL